MPGNKGNEMTPDWLLQVLLLVVGILGSGAIWYFISQKQYHHALWTGFAATILLLVVMTLFIRNEIIKREIQAKTPIYKNKLLCADKAHNHLTLIEYLERKECLKIYDFEITEIEDVGLKIKPSNLNDKVFDQRTATGKFTTAGLLTHGFGGAIIGAIVGGLIEELFPKKYEFHFHIQLRLKTKEKLDMRYLYEEMIYNQETAAAFKKNLNDIVTHLGILLSFLDNNIGRPVRKLWITRY